MTLLKTIPLIALPLGIASFPLQGAVVTRIGEGLIYADTTTFLAAFLGVVIGEALFNGLWIGSSVYGGYHGAQFTRKLKDALFRRNHAEFQSDDD